MAAIHNTLLGSGSPPFSLHCASLPLLEYMDEITGDVSLETTRNLSLQFSDGLQ